MQNSTKLVTFVVVIAILVVLIVVGYNNYQSNQSKLPYTTSTQDLSTSDSTTDIEAELNAATEPEIESDLKDLEQESQSL